MTELTGNLRVGAVSELSGIDAKPGTRIWVDSLGEFYEAVPADAARSTGGVPGPTDGTPVCWVPVEARVVIDGSPVTSLVTAGNIHTTIAGGVGTLQILDFTPGIDEPLLSLQSYFDFSVAESLTAATATGLLPSVNEWVTVSGITRALAYAMDSSSDYGWSTFQETGGSVQRYVGTAVPNEFGPGFVRLKFRYRIQNNAVDAKRYRYTKLAIADANYLVLPSIASLRYPLSDTTASFGTIYQGSDEWYYTRFDCEEIENRTIAITHDSMLVDTGAAWGTQIGRITASIAMTNLGGVDHIRFSAVEFSQERVTEIRPVIGGGVTLRQPSNLLRPTVGWDCWIDGGNVLVEGCSTAANVCSIAGEWGVGTGAFTYGLTFRTRMPYPKTTARQLFAVSSASGTGRVAVSLTTAGRLDLTVTDDAGAAVSATEVWRVPAVPVTLVLVRDGALFTLYVDGLPRLTATTAGAVTLDTLTLFGGRSQSMARNMATDLRARTATEIATLTTAMRRKAGLPDVWPCVLHTAQSNGNEVSGGSTVRLFHQGCPDIGAYAKYATNITTPNTTDRWYASPLRNYSADYNGGHAFGWAAEAAKHRDPWVAINAYEGGRPSSDWTPGHDVYEMVMGAITDAFASLGTHLVALRALTVIQGEADSADVDNAYQANWTAFIQGLRALYGADIPVVMHRLNTWLGGPTDQAATSYTQSIRDGADAIAAALPLVYVSRYDGGAEVGYNVHYPITSAIQIARQMYQLATRRPVEVAKPPPQCIQSGSWTTGGYWHLESGVTTAAGTALGNVVTAAALEGVHTPLTAAGDVPVIAGYSPNNLKCISSTGGRLEFTGATAAISTQFSGTNKPLILFAQFHLKTGAPVDGLLISLQNEAGTHIAASLGFNGTGDIVATRTDGAVTATRTSAIVDEGLYAFVAYFSGSNLYLIDDSHEYVAAAYSTLVTVDRLVVADAIGADAYIRRWGFKAPATADGLGEAVELHRSLYGLT